ncbi:uncharacterized protein LOC126666865 [Mercurialis annua]|uniref:uncharacterized protein LOC126666865 n=1 Tax=Mercurialis annua TaxID=3986 RepID=UPI00215FF0EA|nr:uncharacterized protein LOC126666865 [Mercurialis annua]
MGKYSVIEEKALYNYNHKLMIDSLEEKVSVFLDEPNINDNDDDDYEDYGGFDESGDANFEDYSIERDLFWESQQALLQEVVERSSVTGKKLREEINKIIESAKESTICNCHNHKSNACIITCLRQRVVRLLCQKGLDATLCTSKWNHTKKFPGGKHEYIEVTVSTSGRKKQITYIIELEFQDQFEIAKACEEYKKLISQLPKYYIGKADYLSAIVNVVCESAKRSMKEKKIHMGPWRKTSFMQMKWSSTCSAPIAEFSSRQSHDSCSHLSTLTVT